MKKITKILTLTVAITLAGFTSAALSAENQTPSIQIPQGSLSWSAFNPGIEIAFANGSAETGPLSFFLRMAPGYKAGTHTHDGDYHGVVLEGTISNPVAGSNLNSPLPAGSYWFQPKDQAHDTDCVSNARCVIYIQQQSGLSFHPTK